MVSSDAILVGEGWISEHYFTTDATSQSFQSEVVKRRKEWDAEEKDGHPTPRTRFTAARQELVSALARLGAGLSGDEAADGVHPGAGELAAPIHERIVEILGLDGHGLRQERTGPIIRISAPGITERAPLAVLLAEPVDSVEDLISRHGATLTEPVQLDEDGETYSSVARLLSALFVEESAPDLVVVLAGRWALLAERERWAEGRYLALDVQAMAERNDTKRGGEIDRLLTCLSAESIAPNPDGDLWWHGVLAESIKHTVGVSQDLRDGVRLSIEIIANEVVHRRVAKGLDPLPGDQAQELARQALRFLYRILFLLYAEASPELGVLPVGAQEYDEGYSLDRLRELVQVELATPQGRDGTHLYNSLGVLFRLVENGNDPKQSDDEDGAGALTSGLAFNPLRADLFRPSATAHIDAVGLGNHALQRVLAHLLLSKEKRGRDRGFISYAELGINQLGAVYEGLMSYTGFFAGTDLFEVAKNGDASKGSWVVPIDRADGIAPADFVKETADNGQQVPVRHPRGSFVFRLAGRERQQSASYYTPEVLTRFTVGQALEELLDQDGHTTTAAEILDLTVCEPALGSGAFAIEAVRQLAAQYLERRQKELDRRIDPDDYPRRLQEVKAYLALHNVYGVDLNSTAVELAEISLWLDTMVEGLAAPWFGLHLRRGNSLIGARRAVYTKGQVERKAWFKETPLDLALGSDDDADGRVHHFLLPAEGWGSTIDAKEAKPLAPDVRDALRAWRRMVSTKPTRRQTEAFVDLGRRVEALWRLARRRLEIAESEVRRSVNVWGADHLSPGGAVTREEIESSLGNPDGAYRRLRRVMDAWCALWFWPLTESSSPPSLDEWIETLQKLLGRSGRESRIIGQQSFGSASTWDELGLAETAELGFSGAVQVTRVIDEHSWLAVAERVADRQGFFHWELDFSPVFDRGGFDLQVGNPPWVRPRSDVDALLAESDPWWQLKAKSTSSEDAAHRARALAVPGTPELLLDGTAEVAATAAFVGDATQYPFLAGLQPDLYRCFMEQTWRHSKSTGSVGLIHLESHFTDEKAGLLRAETYRRLRRHWQFINELLLFEIEDHKRYGIHVYGRQREPTFLQAASIYHPDTVERSLKHDGSGVEPGIKDPDGRWDVRPHASRIVHVTPETLASWHAVLETGDVPVGQTRMVYAVNKSTAAVLERLAAAPRISDLGLRFSPGWHEKNDRKKGFFDSEWGVPESWDQVILQGPHLHVATPFYKTPNPTMLHNQDWTATDFEALAPDAIPATAYKPRGDRAKYDAAYTHWTQPDGAAVGARRTYRVAWRRMAANTGERTLISAIIPRGATHVDGLFSAGMPGSNEWVPVVAALAGSLVHDFMTRVAPKGDIRSPQFERLPWLPSEEFVPEIALRALRLNCVTTAWADLWRECFTEEFLKDSWTSGFAHYQRRPLGDVARVWSSDTLLRVAADRRQAMLEIDALVALALGITADELCTIYRTQFPVLYGYDRTSNVFDANGRVVPTNVLSAWRRKSDSIGEEERVALHPGSLAEYVYELPFRLLDREADLRTAHSEFVSRLLARSANTA